MMGEEVVWGCVRGGDCACMMDEGMQSSLAPDPEEVFATYTELFLVDTFLKVLILSKKEAEPILSACSGACMLSGQQKPNQHSSNLIICEHPTIPTSQGTYISKITYVQYWNTDPKCTVST